jgi:Fe-Mn family superoxide dismutase
MLKMDGGEPAGDLAKAMDSAFGNFPAFKENFSKAAASQFGSGWAWLVIDSNKQLSIEASPNQDSPVSHGKQPLLGIDVWEHAYYLKYQNRRPEYLTAFFHVINWGYVAERYGKAIA